MGENQGQNKIEEIRDIFAKRDKANELLPNTINMILESIRNRKVEIDIAQVRESFGIDEETAKMIFNRLEKKLIIDDNGKILLNENEIIELLKGLGNIQQDDKGYIGGDSGVEEEAIKNFEKSVYPENPDLYEPPLLEGIGNFDNKQSKASDSIFDRNKYKITIGSECFLQINNTDYLADKGEFKKAAELNIFFEENQPYQITEKMSSIFSNQILKLIIDCKLSNTPIDFTIINSINSVDIPREEKDALIKEYITKVLKSRYDEYKQEYPNEDIETSTSIRLKKYKDVEKKCNITINYDMNGLSKIPSFFSMLVTRHPEERFLNGKEKVHIAQLANKAKQYGLASISGKYELKESRLIKFLKRFKKSTNLLLPLPEDMKIESPKRPNIRQEIKQPNYASQHVGKDSSIQPQNIFDKRPSGSVSIEGNDEEQKYE